MSSAKTSGKGGLVKSQIAQFQVKEGSRVDLSRYPTLTDPLYKSKSQYEKILSRHIEELSKQQYLLYASNSHSLLLIFQAMDAAGKDGAIAHVMSGVNPQGCQVYSFKHPSAEELEHDFLWRTSRCLPERGRIGIFNRSYYEEVLIVRVHPEILLAQGLSDLPKDENTMWADRYQSITQLERHLTRNGTRVIKFFLHISEDEQKRRFIERIDNPDKNWKFSDSDMTERKFWTHYMHAYEECLSHTSLDMAPWYVIPADDKKNARLFISGIILETMKGLGMKMPKVGPARLRELKSIRKQLEAR
jgi:PPK2 family polyphosphate:nucleotide phosphotransferase